MSGTIPLSLTQQFDEFGKPLKGGQLYLIQAGTVSTPQDGFQDPALVSKMPYPITLDAAGRIPQFFLADGFIKVRLQDSRGVVQLASESIQVVGPSGGGVAGTPVDPTALVQMGNVIARYGVGVLGGYVRLNGLTIGSAVSGATERANADTQALFQYLWIADPALAVSGGRGASAALDWAANKTIALPDFRNRLPAGLGDMGNTDAALLTSAFFGASGTLLGAIGGNERMPGLSTLHLPPYTPAGSISVVSTVNNIGRGQNTGDFSLAPAGGGSVISAFVAGSRADSAITSNGNLVGTAQGGTSRPFPIVQPTILLTFYIKL